MSKRFISFCVELFFISLMLVTPIIVFSSDGSVEGDSVNTIKYNTSGAITLGNQCTISPCFEMSFDVSKGIDFSDIVKFQGESNSRGIISSYLLIRGKLSGRKEDLYKIKFRSYANISSCSAFGIGNVAVVGFSSRGFPIVISDSGNFEITDNRVLVGCKDCLRVFKGGKKIRTLITPHQDFKKVRIKQLSIAIDSGGDVYIKRSDGPLGKACIRLENTSLFSLSPLDKCSTANESMLLPVKKSLGVMQWKYPSLPDMRVEAMNKGC